MTAVKNKDLMFVWKLLVDEKTPKARKLDLLKQLALTEAPGVPDLLMELLSRAGKGDGEDQYNEKIRALNEQLKILEEGPLRMGTFISCVPASNGTTRAKVRMEDGATIFPAVFDAPLAETLRQGDSVLVDAQVKCLISGLGIDTLTGVTAVFQRPIGTDRVEISMQGDERHVYHAAHGLMNAVDRGDVRPGALIQVCPSRRFAFAVLKEEDGLSGYRYLDPTPVPDVVVKRDLGDPHPFILEMARMVKEEMTDPELRRRYGLPRCTMKLLAGISGSGKSYSIRAMIRSVAEVVAEVTGVPLDQLPPRVMRFQPSAVLSQWLGESDKNISRFFEEACKLAAETLSGPGGEVFSLPVILVLEEIDGLTRHRGSDAVYDRILTTILELLDPTRPELKDSLVLVVGTTNVAELIDMAFMRRIGGTIEHFGRLTRRAFSAVLGKKLAALPFARSDGRSERQMRDAAVTEVTSWLFSPNGDTQATAALYVVGSSVPQNCYRRDFLTAGLVDRAVQQAAGRFCKAEAAGCPNPGITVGGLKMAIDDQIQATAGLLRAENAARYLELPEGVRVQSVQVIAPPLSEDFGELRAA